VHDDEARPPTTSDAAVDAESGRGMLIVDAVASDSGVDRVEGDGKVVWARVDPEHDSA
jgi:hypothetical protein